MLDILADPTLAFLAASAALKYGVFMSLNDRKPKDLKQVGRVTGIRFYPVKSAATVEIQEAKCTFTGVINEGLSDRAFIVTLKQEGLWRMITARREPTVELIKPSIHGNYLHLDAPGMDTLKLPKNVTTKQGSIGVTNVWGEDIKGVDCGDDAAKWLRTYLKKEDENFRLLQYAPGIKMRNCGEGALANFQTVAKETDNIRYQDAAPYLLCCQQSLDDVNEKTTTQITMKHFRPNIIVDGCDKPFTEDGWETIWIGEAKFTKLFLCDRCIMTTVNPETAKHEPNQEPKSTLDAYRTLIPKLGPMFGIMLVTNKEGVIKVGDPVYATRTDKIVVGTTGIQLNV